ncbi:ubiquinone biosynthesis monooxygenase COQ6 [Pneumocystis murina B123]|uniref:Ubiquinone biosynthesis monooxygenase COQ6, mitochondrial n=1 Tax=Pneumocystis murina (strain B123) TaxID=1069680 RepID=M7NVP5_PNEMU|nr:ubiquinone biosynthesis monooxygenase COQ6 [Pneumocystis murina B123]EMR11367.1 ubiquinone biosynthesis monooxygenase COQ6 [Pneumocystis murina B123]
MKYLKNVKIPQYFSLNVYDIIIVGGGISGLTLASVLGSKLEDFPLRIALIEKSDLKSLKKWVPFESKYSNRISSLNLSTVLFLEDVGIWKYVKKERVQSYYGMQVWDGISSSRIDFCIGNYKENQDESKALAFMIENANLQSALLKKINEFSNFIDIFDSTKISCIKYDNCGNDVYDLSDWPVVKLLNGKTMISRLLIGADGVHSLVGKFSGIESFGWDYNAHGLVAILKLTDFSSVNEIITAWQRFLPYGPIAILPLPNKYATLVWSCPPEMAAFLKSLPKSTFLFLVNAAYRLDIADLSYILSLKSYLEIESQIKWRLGFYQKNGPVPPFAVDLQNDTRESFQLRTRHLKSYIKERIALLGDAAHTIHPLSGQGLNMGLGDVRSLSRVIFNALSIGQDIGTSQVLKQYESDRYLKNYIMLGVTDKLYKLYSTENPFIVGLRSIGLSGINKFDWIKKTLIRKVSLEF